MLDELDGRSRQVLKTNLRLDLSNSPAQDLLKAFRDDDSS